VASHSPDLPEPRFIELDILRGVAALMVVTFHYKHFLFISDSAGFDTAHLPFTEVLSPLYVYGQYFVELFFSISGYVFFWLYSTAIADRHISITTFVIARFARLYPLYLLTFLLVGAGQGLFYHLYGSTFIYHNQTPWSFLLNLVMVQEWVPNTQMSYNGPAWSISVEVFLYALFFLLCFMRQNRPLIVTAVVCFGILFKVRFLDIWPDFARGVPNFFLGGLVFYAAQALRGGCHEVWRRQIETALSWLLPVLWLAVAVIAHPVYQPAADWLDAHHMRLVQHVFGEDGFVYILLPLTLLLIALKHGRWPSQRLRKAAWLGDISYSVYLWHFPLQLLVMLIAARYSPAVRTALFGSPLAFIAFMTLACGVAWLSYRWFEMPARRALKVWLNRHLATEPALR